MAIVEFLCFECKGKVEVVDSVGFRAECDNCGADAHVCKNCVHYDETAYNSCKETSADVVKEKGRNNYCDYFSPNTGKQKSAMDKKDDLLAAAEALFKKK